VRFFASLSALLALPLAVARISPVRLRKGDTLVMQLAQAKPTREQVDNLRAICTQVWPGHKVVILPADVTLRVVRPDPVPAPEYNDRGWS
jgi:hypothetical protein